MSTNKKTPGKRLIASVTSLKDALANACEECHGSGYVCSRCGESVDVATEPCLESAASACRCPYSGGLQPSVRRCKCKDAKR
mgnify:CR=1 FL=1